MGISLAVDREQYKALCEYHKTQYETEVTRGHKLEDKSAKYLTALTIAITAYSLVFTKWIEKLEKPLAASDWVIIVSIGFTFLCFCSSWSLVFRSLALLKAEKLPASEKTIDAFRDNTLESTYQMLSFKYLEALRKCRENNQYKTDLMSTAYRDIAWSGWSFVISLLLIFISFIW